MARFTSTVQVAAQPPRVFARLTDWPAHARWVPLTDVTVLTPGPGGVGTRFVGRSYLGWRRLGFDDVMEVTHWQPPVAGGSGRCDVVKVGRVLTGTASLVVEPVPGGSTVSWSEDVALRPVRLTRPLAPLITMVGRAGFDRVLRLMARELEAEPAQEPGPERDPA